MMSPLSAAAPAPAPLADAADSDPQESSSSDTGEEVFAKQKSEDRRQAAAKKAREKRRVEYAKKMTAMYREEQQQEVPWHDRRAPRAWHAAEFEHLPELISERRRGRRNELHRRHAQARLVFLKHVQATYGDLIRGWRRALDPDGSFQVTRPTLSKYCRKANVDLDFRDLWRALDKDVDGIVRMEELGPKQAAVLAGLQVWAKRRGGCCAILWDSPEAERARDAFRNKGRWKSDRKMPIKVFAKALAQLDCPVLDPPDAQEQHLSLRCLDLHGCGFLSRSDLEWLDTWKAPPWLSADPDKQAWEKLRGMLMHVYRRPLRAWRVLDKDDSNCVSYAEFQDCCRHLRFRGNVDGAWRYVDADISGIITLAEFDLDSAELLASFKRWVDDTFGAVEAAFRAMDSDGSGVLSFTELKRTCKKLKWFGDVGLIFDCLAIQKLPGVRTMSYKDMEFLDSWTPEEEKLPDIEQPLLPVAAPPPRGTPAPVGGEPATPNAGSKVKKMTPSASCPPGQMLPEISPKFALARPLANEEVLKAYNLLREPPKRADHDR